MTVQNELLNRMFQARGYDDKFLSKLDDFDSGEKLHNVDALAERLKIIHDAGRKIVFIPDFDMDGIAAGVCGFAGLAELGFNVSLYIPDPDAGYGFGPKDIANIISKYPDVTAILTADTGITCYEGVDAGVMAGIEMLVTDHHMTGNRDLNANVIVDPMQPDDNYSNPYICGASVIYQCLQYYADKYCDIRMSGQIRRLKVFAGIGTVSDSMPLIGINRALVRDAISISRLIYSNGTDFVVGHMLGSDIYRRAFKGLRIMLSVFAEAGKIKIPEDIDESFFGYYLAPAFNSVKRIGHDMNLAFGVFFGPDPETNANELLMLNNQRKVMTESYLADIQDQKQPYAPFVYLTDAPAGIRGLLATRLMDLTHGPCLVVERQQDGSYTGSGRSPGWYKFRTRGEDKYCHTAGHELAFGVKIQDELQLMDLCAFLEDDVGTIRESLPVDYFAIRPDFVIDHSGGGDTIIDIVLFLEFLEELSMFRPFGAGFSEPRILLRFKGTDGFWSTMGSTKQHLKIQLAHGLNVICWNQAQEIDRMGKDQDILILGSLSLNEFCGNQSVQFIGDFVE